MASHAGELDAVIANFDLDPHLMSSGEVRYRLVRAETSHLTSVCFLSDFGNCSVTECPWPTQLGKIPAPRVG